MIHKNDPSKNKRNMTGICISNFAIVVKINEIAFDIMFQEKLRRDFDILAKFVYDRVPGMSIHYTIYKVLARAPYIFKQYEVSKGEYIIKENEESECINIILNGSCTLTKTFRPIQFTNFKAPNTCLSVLGLNKGDVFGEDLLFFKRKNKFNVKVTSVSVTYI